MKSEAGGLPHRKAEESVFIPRTTERRTISPTSRSRVQAIDPSCQGHFYSKAGLGRELESRDPLVLTQGVNEPKYRFSFLILGMCVYNACLCACVHTCDEARGQPHVLSSLSF